MADKGMCEHVLGCNARARYRVRRMNRKSDAQDACGRHLAATVDALEEGDGTSIIVDHVKEGSAAR